MNPNDNIKEDLKTINQKLNALRGDIRELNEKFSTLKTFFEQQSEIQFRVSWIFAIYTVGSSICLAGIVFFANWWSSTFSRSVMLNYSILFIGIGLLVIFISRSLGRRYWDTISKKRK